MFGRSLQMDEAKPDSERHSKRARPTLRGVLNYGLLILAFGVIVPRMKGLVFFDPTLMTAYSCMGFMFSGPAAAQAFRIKPGSWTEALRWVLRAVIFGELIALIMLLTGILTVYLTHLGGLFFLPNLAYLRNAQLLGATGSLALAALAGWVTRRFSAGAAQGTLRVVFLVLLILFFYSGQRLPEQAAWGIAISVAAGAAFLELLRRELRSHENSVSV
jgi:hypothetical protein